MPIIMKRPLVEIGEFMTSNKFLSFIFLGLTFLASYSSLQAQEKKESTRGNETGNPVLESSGIAINEDKCKSLAVDVSTVAFSGDTNGMLYDPYDLRKGDGATFINQTKRAIKEELNEFCKNEKTGATLEKFKDKFHMTCSSSCQDQSKMFRSERKKTTADTVCLSICNNTYRSLEMAIDAANLAKSSINKRAGDCSANVSNASRGITQTKDFDKIIEKVKSGSAQK